ncbi:YheC/YheD family protein [Paenibacillus sp. GCM10027629]|uniref:YheC/YheD family protein n=1 Tax=Paenibacillus sp. GCM10027629 TaxID=3273414 RepID=UPI00363478B0
MSRYVSSKWKKTLALLKDNQLRAIIPTTVRFNEQNLNTMLKKHTMLYVKPENGSFGNGVIRVEKHRKHFQYQSKEKIYKFNTYKLMYDALKKMIGKRSYLIQTGIELLKHQKHAFDLRVMVQLNPKHQWEATGIIGRVAAPKKIVTNYHSGGTPKPLEPLLSPYLSKDDLRKKTVELNRIGVRTGQAMQRSFAGVCELGVDIGLDGARRPWIFEVNTSPDRYIFKKHPNKAIFRKIMSYAKSYEARTKKIKK